MKKAAIALHLIVFGALSFLVTGCGSSLMTITPVQ